MRGYTRYYRLLGLVIAVLASITGLYATVSAVTFTGGSYKIDASIIGNSFGGDVTGGSYKLTSSGGESVVGQGAGGSYKLDSGYVAQLPNSLQLTVQPGNLVAYYAMNETGGTAAADTSANSQTLYLGAQTFVAGKVGSSLQFDATANGATTQVSTALNFQSSDFTLEYWYYTTTVTGNRDVMGKFNSGVGGYHVAQLGATPIMYLQSNTISRTCAGITTSTWTHIAFVKQGTSLDCYINGVLANGTLAGSIPTNIGSASNQFQIGNAVYYGGATNALLDEVKLFSRALSAQQVAAESAAGNAGTTAGLGFGADILPGISQTSPYDAIVQTDSVKGYTLAVSQNQNLTKGPDTIAAVSGTIASPASWVEGTTKGLGFTLYGATGTAIDGKWSSGAAYAALPGTATSFYTRTGRQSSKDTLNMRLRLDVLPVQVPGAYTNTMTTTGTITP